MSHPSNYTASFRRPDVSMNLIKHLISICLLMKQCSRVGIPLEQRASLPIKVRFLVEAKEQMTLKLFPQTKLRTPWVYMFILLETKTFLYSGTYRLQIAADGTSELS